MRARLSKPNIFELFMHMHVRAPLTSAECAGGASRAFFVGGAGAAAYSRAADCVPAACAVSRVVAHPASRSAVLK